MPNNIISDTSYLQEMEWRGMIYDATPSLEEHLAQGSVTAYIGFDPTADSLHVGSLLPVMSLARFQRYGHCPIAIVGGGTGLIGDPSGKSQERQLLDAESVEHNLRCIRTQLERFMDFEKGENTAQIINNADWLTTIPLTDFLRDVGKYFTVNYMIRKESIRRRLESDDGISFTEFSYMLLQAYDFVVLHDRYGCTLQMGGSDQWGNITAGIELIRRVSGGQAQGLVFPLVSSSSGTKFGKTEAGTVWLDPGRTSPYKFYQFWLNTDDRDVILYLKYFTWLDREEILRLERAVEQRPQVREAQHALAREVTQMVHGEDRLSAAVQASEILFSGDVSKLSASEIADVFEDAPTVELGIAELEGDGIGLLDLLVRAELVSSRGEARRLVRGGGMYLNSNRVEDEHQQVTITDALDGQVIVLRKGRKSYTLVRLLR